MSYPQYTLVYIYRYDINTLVNKFLLKKPIKWDYLSVRWNPNFVKCFRCKHEWIPRTENPQTCAKCRSPYWNKARDKKNYKEMQLNAALVVQQFIHKKLISKPGNYKCVDCGKPAVHWEHRDYSKPMSIEPVCRSCNKKRSSSNNL